MMKKLRGVIPPMITPFDEAGNLDEKSLQKLVEYLSDKVDGLFICGSYGCGALMSVEERKRVAEIVKKTAKPGTTIVVMTGTTTTKDTIELTQHAADIGCDAAAAVGPYYFKYQDDSLIKFYSDVMKATNHAIPFYAYHNPGFQGYETSMNVMRAQERGPGRHQGCDLRHYEVCALRARAHGRRLRRGARHGGLLGAGSRARLPGVHSRHRQRPA